ncbi:MAG: hypothetical protein MUC47_08990 [Candidatus Kapabacteria bacterium]|jgi:hypothetical protein|nr:hypothetical protein [Candidatus Kapabacteria bacterium]
MKKYTLFILGIILLLVWLMGCDNVRIGNPVAPSTPDEPPVQTPEPFVLTGTVQLDTFPFLPVSYQELSVAVVWLTDTEYVVYGIADVNDTTGAWRLEFKDPVPATAMFASTLPPKKPFGWGNIVAVRGTPTNGYRYGVYEDPSPQFQIVSESTFPFVMYDTDGIDTSRMMLSATTGEPLYLIDRFDVGYSLFAFELINHPLHGSVTTFSPIPNQPILIRAWQ